MDCTLQPRTNALYLEDSVLKGGKQRIIESYVKKIYTENGYVTKFPEPPTVATLDQEPPLKQNVLRPAQAILGLPPGALEAVVT
jgi:hypothetical protein